MEHSKMNIRVKKCEVKKCILMDFENPLKCIFKDFTLF